MHEGTLHTGPGFKDSSAVTIGSLESDVRPGGGGIAL